MDNANCPFCHKQYYNPNYPDDGLYTRVVACLPCNDKRNAQIKENCNKKGGNEAPDVEKVPFKGEKPIIRGKKGQVWWQMLKGRGGK